MNSNTNYFTTFQLTGPFWQYFLYASEAIPADSVLLWFCLSCCHLCGVELFCWNSSTRRPPFVVRHRRFYVHCWAFEHKLFPGGGSIVGGRRVGECIGSWTSLPVGEPPSSNTWEGLIIKIPRFNKMSDWCHTLNQGIPRFAMPSSRSWASLGLSGGWSSLSIPGLSSPDMSCSIGTSDISLRSEMDDTFRLERTESERLMAEKKNLITMSSLCIFFQNLIAYILNRCPFVPCGFV